MRDGDELESALAELEAYAEPPIAFATLVASARSRPHAALAAVRLLRSIEGLAPAEAIRRESLAYGALQAGPEHAAWLAGRAAGAPGAAGAAGGVHLNRAGDRLDIRIDRPWAHNAIDVAIRDGLHAAFTLADLDRSIARVTVRSVGPAFSIGADLSEFGTTRDAAAAHRIRMATLPALPLARRAEIVEVHVQGACIGAGLEMAAFAGRIIAAPNAWFQLPELAMGLIPGAGGCVSVGRRIGWRRAALMILSGRRIGAKIARAWGLIDAIDPDLAHGDRGEIAARRPPWPIEQA